jgi:hypothetical protein
LLNIVPTIRRAATDLGAADRVQIAVIVIENQPIFAPDCAKPKPGGPTTPFEILDLLRQARSEDFLSRLRDLVHEGGKDLLLNPARPTSRYAELLLGWTLPIFARAEMSIDAPTAAVQILRQMAGKLD